MTTLASIMNMITNMIFNEDDTIVVYKLFRKKNGELYPLFVNANEAIPMGKWLRGSVGQKADESHVKSRLGKLSLRPGVALLLSPLYGLDREKGRRWSPVSEAGYRMVSLPCARNPAGSYRQEWTADFT